MVPVPEVQTPAMLPMATLVNASTSSLLERLPVICTVAEARVVLSTSATVMAVLIAVATWFSV